MNRSSPEISTQNRTVAIVGGGLAGMATAVAALRQGLRVELFERSRHLGGRAGSFREPQTGQLVDLCPHVAMGCCTHLIDFCRRTGLIERFERYRDLHFFGPDGARYDFSASRWLPAPLHLIGGLMRLGYLTRREQWGIAGALVRLARHRATGGDGEPTIGEWLRRQGQSDRVIERFWSVILVSALGERVDRASMAAARKVFRDGFLASRDAYEVLVPQVPLGQLWQHVGQWLTERGAKLHLDTRIERIECDGRQATGLLLPDGTRRRVDFVVSAVPWWQVRRLLRTNGDCPPFSMPWLDSVEQIRPSPITAVHLWFDRAIGQLPHAALVGRLSQWVFRGASPHHTQVVISASHALAARDRPDILAEVLGDLKTIWPATSAAQLLGWRIVTHPAAVFSVGPGTDRLRPAGRTPIENLLLAGDWTATGWPATMESAVRSGTLAVEEILRSLGRPERLSIDGPRIGWLARLIAGKE